MAVSCPPGCSRQICLLWSRCWAPNFPSPAVKEGIPPEIGEWQQRWCCQHLAQPLISAVNFFGAVCMLVISPPGNECETKPLWILWCGLLPFFLFHVVLSLLNLDEYTSYSCKGTNIIKPSVTRLHLVQNLSYAEITGQVCFSILKPFSYSVDVEDGVNQFICCLVPPHDMRRDVLLLFLITSRGCWTWADCGCDCMEEMVWESKWLFVLV